MEDRRAHDRIDNLEVVVAKHHAEFEADLAKNTRLTQEIANNTSELVALLKGVKGLRSLVVWGAPLVAAVVACIAYFKGYK